VIGGRKLAANMETAPEKDRNGRDAPASDVSRNQDSKHLSIGSSSATKDQNEEILPKILFAEQLPNSNLHNWKNRASSHRSSRREPVDRPFRHWKLPMSVSETLMLGRWNLRSIIPSRTQSRRSRL
jgi:hypothetical protein